MKSKAFVVSISLLIVLGCSSKGDFSNDLEMFGTPPTHNIVSPKGICTENCVLGYVGGSDGEIVYDVKKFYNSGGENFEGAEPRNRDWWVYDRFPHKVMGLTLKIRATCPEFSVEYSDQFKVESHCNDRIMQIQFGKNTVAHTISEDAKKIAIGWDVLPGEEASMQVVQLDSRGQSLKSSIVYDVIYGEGSEEQKQNDSPVIRVKNLSYKPASNGDEIGTLEVTGASFAVREDLSGRKSGYANRPIRSLDEFACTNPLLAFFDFMFTGYCDKVGDNRPAQNLHEYVPEQGNSVYVSGSHPNPVKVDDRNMKQNPSEEFSLRRVVSAEDINVAAAVVTTFKCGVPYREVIGHRSTVIKHRKPRGLDESEPATRRCISYSFDIVTPFVRLFRGRIGTMFENTEQGVREMVQSILDGRGTGHPISSNQMDTESQLISAVQELTRIMNDGGREAQSLLSSAVGVGRYWDTVESQGDSAEQIQDAEGELIRSINFISGGPNLQRLILGEYELDMGSLVNWVRTDQIPQLWSGNGWRSSSERFTSEIFYSRNFRRSRADMLPPDLMLTLREWDDQYDAATKRKVLSEDKMKYYEEAYSICDYFQEMLTHFTTRRNEILVVVRFRGRPVSFLLGNLDSVNDDGTADLELMLSGPDKVVEEYRQEDVSVQGAGAQAMGLFLEEMKKNRAIRITSNVVTQASARIHLRWNFRRPVVIFSTTALPPSNDSSTDLR